ncbi:MmyB family transcriptional regulator [Corallococcus caeni]|uniref:MmyB family transcriptional regulator n=1 Tax=Corallococcus caeni TaxID=3082388 RepID=UPI003F7FB89E
MRGTRRQRSSIRTWHGLLRGGRNALWELFMNPDRRASMPTWAQAVRRAVAGFRLDAARAADRSGFDALVEKLQAASPEFARLWSEHDVVETPSMLKVIERHAHVLGAGRAGAARVLPCAASRAPSGARVEAVSAALSHPVRSGCDTGSAGRRSTGVRTLHPGPRITG